MGALCSCFHVSDVQENDGSNNSNSNNCLCPKCIFRRLKNKCNVMQHGNIFNRGQTNATSSPNQQASSPYSGFVMTNSSNASAPHAGAVANNGSFRQWNGARGRQEGSNHRSRVQPEPVRQSDVQVNPNSVQGYKTLVSMGLEEQNFGSSEKVLSSGVDGFACTFPSPDYKDECPTCLEEYTEENPKIMAKCSHHYHLSCIYEWMERSQNCPACGKLMQFEESI